MVNSVQISKKYFVAEQACCYTLKIQHNGTIYLSGNGIVKPPFKHCWFITAKSMQAIDNLIDEVDFFNVLPLGTVVHQYNSNTISIHIEMHDGSSRSVIRQGSIEPNWPASLNNFDLKIENLCCVDAYLEERTEALLVSTL